MANTFAQFSGSGAGTENDPYLIFNPIQLNQIRNFSSAYFKLMADIDLTEFIEDEYPRVGWLPINSYGCILDGNEKTISGLWIKRSETDKVGLFGSLSKGTIKNLTLKAQIEGNNNVGALVGQAFSSSFNNCSIEAVVSGNSRVGGVVGGVENRIYSGCSFSSITASVIVEAKNNYVGGCIGYGGATIVNCNLQDSRIKGGDEVGGLAGCYASINNSCFIGVINGNTYVGGLVGKNNKNNIYNSYSLSDVLASGDYVGGIIGESGGNCSDCLFSGSVSGVNNVGGIMGCYLLTEDHYSIELNRCLVMAQIEGNDYVGGICGKAENRFGYVWSYLRIRNNAAVNSIISSKGDNIGRICCGNISDNRFLIVGENKTYNKTPIIINGISQNYIEDSNQNGTGVSATTLKLKATYVAMQWDFSDVWAIQETECFPYLMRQTSPPNIMSELVAGATNIKGKCEEGSIVTLYVEDEKIQTTCKGNDFSFSVSPLQAGKELRFSAKADGKEQSYYIMKEVSYKGKGTESDPYQIFSAEDLTGVYRKGFYKQMNDIDLTEWINKNSYIEGWIPIWAIIQ